MRHFLAVSLLILGVVVISGCGNKKDPPQVQTGNQAEETNKAQKEEDKKQAKLEEEASESAK